MSDPILEGLADPDEAAEKIVAIANEIRAGDRDARYILITSKIDEIDVNVNVATNMLWSDVLATFCRAQHVFNKELDSNG